MPLFFPGLRLSIPAATLEEHSAVARLLVNYISTPMRRLILLFVAIALLLWGRSILLGDGVAPAIALRDGLLIVLLGLVTFAINSASPPRTDITTSPDNPSRTGTIGTIGTVIGFGLALAGGAWLLLALNSAGGNVAGGNGGGENSALLLPLLLWLIGLAGGMGVLLWGRRPQPNSANQTPGVWTVESARQFLQRREADGEVVTQSHPLEPVSRTHWIALALIVAVSLLLRLWNFAGLTDGCLALECDGLVAGMDFLGTGSLHGLLETPSPLYTLLLSAVLGVFGVSATSTLALGLLLGTATIPLFYAAARRFVTPVVALLGTLLLVFSPAHIALSRHPASPLLLLLLVYGWLALRPGDQNQTAHRWAGAGLVAGLAVLAAPPPLTWLLLLWFALTPPPRRSHWLAYFGPLVAAALPGLGRGLGGEIFGITSPAHYFEQAGEMAGQLLTDGGYLSGQPGLPQMLALLGAAYLLRYLRWREGWLWSVGFFVAGLFIFATPNPTDLLYLSPLLALLGVSGVVALDQILGQFSRVWSPVLSARRVALATAGLLVLLLASGGISRLNALAEQSSQGQASSHAAIGAYLYEHLQPSTVGDGPLVLVPWAVLVDPATQLAARGILADSSRLVALDPVVHLPFVGPPFIGPPFIDQAVGDLLYILPESDGEIGRSLSAIYPGLAPEPIQDASGQNQAAAYFVSRSQAASAQGLPVRYFEGEAIDPLPETVEEVREGPLDFDWQSAPPVVRPFVLTGQGALYIPEAGVRGFRIVAEGGVTAQMEVEIPLAQAVALDTEAGISEVVVDLPQGFYPLRLTANSGADGGTLSVQWQRPGSPWETIPRQALYSAEAAQPNGLLARYYGAPIAGSGSQGFDGLTDAPILGWRMEPWMVGSELQTAAWGVIWQGKVAVPVEGTYAFAVQADGPHQLDIDGNLLIDGPDGSGPDGSEGHTSLHLSQGWHDLALRYLPGVSSKVASSKTGRGIQLRWQPPGAGRETTLPSAFLLPLQPDVSAAGLAMPDLPKEEDFLGLTLAQPQTGPGFAAELQTPGEGSLVTELPELPFSLVWQVGSCGADIEQFSQPRGVALNRFNEVVYVADQGNRRMVLRDLSDGALVDYYDDETFEEPFDVDVNLLGKVFLLDAAAQTIYAFEEPQGTAIPQANETTFYRPRGMGMDLIGNFYVADTGGARVVALNGRDGAVELQVGGPDSALGQGQPVDVLVLPTGAVYAITAQDGRLWRVDTGESWPAVVPANTFDGPHLAGLTTSNFFVSDPERRLVLYYSQTGQPLGQLSSELFAKPVGVGGLILDGDVLLAVSDSVACQVSLWRAPVEALPVDGLP